jgi:hypothetical protein
MSIFDKVVAAVTPPESEKARAEARAKANAAAQPGDWLSLILDHHLQIEDAIAQIKAAGDGASRRSAQKQLAIVLTGHAGAEETVLYPAMADNGEMGHADMGYGEQVAVKMQMAALEKLDPMSQDYLDKLEHIEGALAHHMYEEEGSWFLKLKEKASPADQTLLTARFAEEFARYVGDDVDGSGRFGARSGDSGFDEPRSFA